MSFVGDMLFGSKGKAPTAQDTTPAEFSQLRGPLTQALQGLFPGGGGSPVGNIPGAPTGVAGMGGQEQDLLGRIFAQTNTASPFMQEARGQVRSTLGGEGFNSPHLQGAIDAATRPAIRAFEEQVMPNLRAGFTNAGQMIQPGGSSPFDKALAQAGTSLVETVGDISSRMSQENFQAERNRQIQAVSQAAGIDRQQLESRVAGLQATALPRMIEQLGIDQGIAEFNNRLTVLLQVLQQAGTLSAPNVIGMPGAPGTQGMIPAVASGIGGGFAGPFGAALGGAASNALLGR